ncbi:methyltransferase domain-containing protein [uncultured Amaricoccus sp.]|uniref:class I SAM-dependent methyltransferase n=1 Tax=uncultured Amaricoccus sp. TaxID=339341 RepID=UPI002635AB7D|nr:methyltransferase domain-containing protein [uncultured Amaricoccus sp.]
MQPATVNRFRTNRGRILRRMIDALADTLGRDIVILDVGGTPDYWGNLGTERIARIELLNRDDSQLDRPTKEIGRSDLFTRKVGDARDLSAYADQSMDLVHSNSVIEHVGGWSDMRAMANEIMRVGRAGWMQTPAWEFPIEPHFRMAIGHWFGKPMQARLMGMSVDPTIRRLDLDRRRRRLEGINLLSKSEVRALFPNREILTERVILAKSYVVRWAPASPTAAQPSDFPQPADARMSKVEPTEVLA